MSDAELEARIEANKKIYTEHFDPLYVEALVENLFETIDETWFRSRFIGFDAMPERNNPDVQLILASNHSGMAFPWDAIVFVGGLARIHKFEKKASLRPLTAPMLSQSTLMNPYLIKNFWKRAGGVDASTLNFETLMRQKESNILIYPEGVAGIGKGFNRRYQLQKFATSILRMSLKYKTDVIPFATINGEYINPYVYSFDPVNKLVQKIGVPFIPVGLLTTLLPFFPWLFYFAFPANLTFIRGKRIKPYEIIDRPFEEVTRADLEKLRDEMHAQMQRQFDQAVEEFGQQPFRARHLVKCCFKNKHNFPFFLPVGWPFLFTEFERQYQKTIGKMKKMRLSFGRLFKFIFRNPITLAYFIPILGWIPILIKGYRENSIKSKKQESKT